MLSLSQGATVVIALMFVALCTGAITFVTLLWFYDLPAAVLGAMGAASIMTPLAGAIMEFRRSAVSEPDGKERPELINEDDRKATRVQGFMRGRLEWDDGRSGSDCIVHDLSDTGARLGVPRSVALPEPVILYIAEQTRTVIAAVRWRTADQVGVEFLSPALTSDSDDLAVQNANLKAEIARLRAMLDERWAHPRQGRI